MVDEYNAPQFCLSCGVSKSGRRELSTSNRFVLLRIKCSRTCGRKHVYWFRRVLHKLITLGTARQPNNQLFIPRLELAPLSFQSMAIEQGTVCVGHAQEVWQCSRFLFILASIIFVPKKSVTLLVPPSFCSVHLVVDDMKQYVQYTFNTHAKVQIRLSLAMARLALCNSTIHVSHSCYCRMTFKLFCTPRPIDGKRKPCFILLIVVHGFRTGLLLEV